MKWLVLRFLKREESSGPKLFDRKGGYLIYILAAWIGRQQLTMAVLYVGHLVT